MRIMMIKPSKIPSDYGAQHPRRYYFIDLGLSRQYSTRDTTDELPSGRMNLAPETRTGMRCNPFRTDIYYIGKLVREKFIDVRVLPSVNLRADLPFSLRDSMASIPLVN
jgi:hypothetical protein